MTSDMHITSQELYFNKSTIAPCGSSLDMGNSALVMKFYDEYKETVMTIIMTSVIGMTNILGYSALVPAY